MIYADNAATTKLDEDAFEAMRPFLLDEYGNPSQPYSFSRVEKKALRDARSIIASCIGALDDEIYFTSGGTESDNWAVKGFVDSKDSQMIITSQIEHHAILNACIAMERLGVPVCYLPVSGEGIVESESLQSSILKGTKLISVMLANNEIGTVEPVATLAHIAHEHGSLFHTDAVQAVGHIPVNVKTLGIDLLSASGHKFNGPKGVGFLYVKRGTKIKPYIDGGGQEFGLRAGTENVASIIAMAFALRKNCDRMFAVSKRLSDMERDFLQVLDQADVDYIRNGAERHIPGNINISIRNASGERLLHRLDLKGICISTGSACDSVNTQVSHVIRAVGVPDEYARGTIRISFGADNVKSDAFEVAKALIEILGKSETT